MRNGKQMSRIALSAVLCMGLCELAPLPHIIQPSSVQAAQTTGPQMNVPYTVPSFKFAAWQNVAIPSNAFLKNATSAEVTVKGAVYVAFSKQRDPWNYTDLEGGVFNWSNSNKAGVTFVLTGENLKLALEGGLFVRADSSDGVTLTVKNIGTAGNVDVEPEQPSQPDEPSQPEDVTSYETNLWEWSDIQIQATAFGQQATKARLTVKNACYARFSHKVNGQITTLPGGEFSWSDSNRNGITFELTGELLAEAKQGNLFVYVGGANGKTITLTINSEGVAEPEPEQPVEPEPEQPVEPEPEQPVEPEPEQPVEPEPEQPVEPEPEQPVEPEPEQPVEPEPEQPVEPEPEQPVEPEPEQPVEPEPEQPVVPEPEQPSDPAAYGVIKTSTKTLSEWSDIQLSASLFDANADKAKLTVSGACYVKFTQRINGSLTTLTNGEYSWNDNNKGGVHYELTGDLLKAALAGNIYVWVGGGSPINLLVNSYGQGGKPEGEIAGSDDIDTSDVLDPTVRAYMIAKRMQLTENPTLYLTIPDAEGKDVNTVLFKDRSTNTADYHKATLQLVDNNEEGLESFTDEVEIKVRGNSTADMIKRPYRLKFPKDEKNEAGKTVVNHKHDMLGSGYKKRNWTLLANYVDPSLARNALAYHIGELVGMPFCPGYKFTDVVINNEYRGLYQISDHVEVGKNRINVNEDTGWYVEVSRGDMIEEPSLFAGMLPMSIKNPEPQTEAETAALKAEVSAWFTEAQNVFFSNDRSRFLDPETGWRAYFDEDSFVDYYVAINLTGDYDGFMSVKMYREAAKNGKMKLGPLWDKDLAYGNFSADNGTTLVEDMNNGQFDHYVKKVTSDPGFMQKVYDKVHALENEGLSDQIQDYIDQIVSIIGRSEELNQTRWPGHMSWIYNFGTYSEAVQQLKNYEQAHVNYFIGEVDRMYAAAMSAPIRDESTAIGMLTSQTDALHCWAGKGSLSITSVADQQVVVSNISGAVVARLDIAAGTSQTISLPTGIYTVAGQKVVVK